MATETKSELDELKEEMERRQRLVNKGRVVKEEKVGPHVLSVVATAEGHAVLQGDHIVRWGLPRQTAMGEVGGAKGRGRL